MSLSYVDYEQLNQIKVPHEKQEGKAYHRGAIDLDT